MTNTNTIQKKLDAPHGFPSLVYRAYDRSSRLLYVGCTSDLKARMSAHRTASAWHPHMVRLEQTEVMPFKEARAAELAAILKEQPLYNMNTPGRVGARTLREMIIRAAGALAARDGWIFNDVYMIGKTTADLLIRAKPVGTEFHQSEAYEAHSKFDWFNGDQLPFVWAGMRSALDGGWEPTSGERARWVLLPYRWDVWERGQLPPGLRF